MAELTPGVEQEARRPRVSLSLALRWLMSLGGILTLMGGLHAYIAVRLFVSPQLPLPWAWLGPVLVALLFLPLPVGMVVSRREPTLWAQVLQWTSYVWLGAFGILAIEDLQTEIAFWAETKQPETLMVVESIRMRTQQGEAKMRFADSWVLQGGKIKIHFAGMTQYPDGSVA